MLGSNGAIRWWRYGLCGPDEVTEVADRFDQSVHHPDHTVETVLERGDLLLMDNFRTLHGRSSFTGGRRLVRLRTSGRTWDEPFAAGM